MAPKKHLVDFVATKMVKEPTEVSFITKSGVPVDFTARKPVRERGEVSFMARDKKT
jgi:hypothetical protein